MAHGFSTTYQAWILIEMFERTHDSAKITTYISVFLEYNPILVRFKLLHIFKGSIDSTTFTPNCDVLTRSVHLLNYSKFSDDLSTGGFCLEIQLSWCMENPANLVTNFRECMNAFVDICWWMYSTNMSTVNRSAKASIVNE